MSETDNADRERRRDPEKPYAPRCRWCGKRFGLYDELSEHVKDTHPGISHDPRPRCAICEDPIEGDFVAMKVFSGGTLDSRSYYCRDSCAPPGGETADIENTDRDNTVRENR